MSATDVLGGSLSGTVTVGATGRVIIPITLREDATTEGAETVSMTIAGQTASVIVNDTSLTPAPVDQRIQLVQTVETKTGAAGNDTLFGTNVTFNTGDVLDGGLGNNVLVLDLDNTAAYSSQARLDNIQTLNVFAGGTAGATLNAFEWTGVNNVNFNQLDNTAAVVFNQLGSIPTVTVSDADGNGAATFNFRAAAVAGTADEMTINVSGASNTGALTLNGIETATINNTANANSVLLAGAALRTINANSDAGTLTLETLAGLGVTAFTASGAGNVTLTDTLAGMTTLNAAALDGVLTANISNMANAAAVVTITGGDGADVFTSANAFGNGTDVDVLDGGAGNNALRFTLAADTAEVVDAQATVSNIQTVRITASDDAGAGTAVDPTFNAALVGGLQTLEFVAADTETANVFTVTRLPASGATLSVTGVAAGGITIDAALAADTGAADQVAVALSAAANVTSEISINQTNAGGAGSNGIEVLALSLNGRTYGDVEIETGAAAFRTVNVSGTGTATLGGTTALTATTINGGTASANVTLNLGTANQTITTGSGNDTLNFGTNLTSADTITDNGGADRLTVDMGATTVAATISGIETIRVTDANVATLNLANVSGLTTLELDGITTGTLAVTNAASGLNVNVTTANTAATSINTAAAGSSVTTTYTVNSANSPINYGANINNVAIVLGGTAVNHTAIDSDFASIARTLNIGITGTDATAGLTFTTDFTDAVRDILINSAVAVTMDVSADTLSTATAIDYTGSTGAVTLTVSSAQLATNGMLFTGGSATTDRINATVTAANTASVSAFETVGLNNTGAAGGVAIDTALFAGATTFAVTLGAAQALTLNNVASGSTVAVTDGSDAAINIDSSVATGVGQSLTLSLVNDVDGSDPVVTDFANITVNAGVSQTSLNITASDAEVVTVAFTGGTTAVPVNIVLVALADLSGAETIDLSGLNGSFDSTNNGAFAANANIILGAGNVDVDLDLAAGAAQTITFSNDLDQGEVVTIAGFGGTAAGVNADVLNLAALGVTGVASLTFTNNGLNVEITSALFEGQIVLVGTLAADINASNFVFA